MKADRLTLALMLAFCAAVLAFEVFRGPKAPEPPEPEPPCKDTYDRHHTIVECDPRARLETITEYTEDGPRLAVICRCERADAGAP